jgi:hypothetical protein
MGLLLYSAFPDLVSQLAILFEIELAMQFMNCTILTALIALSNSGITFHIMKSEDKKLTFLHCSGKRARFKTD